jgi:sulfur-carrier protein
VICVRVVLPAHLRELARVESEVQADVSEDATIAEVLDAIERDHPTLRGTIRDQTTHERRPYMRYIACGEDLSHLPPTSRLPVPVALGEEPLLIIGAIAGGAR